MTVLAILFFCGFVTVLTALLVQLFMQNHRANRQQTIIWDASARIHDVTDQALRKMLEEAMRTMNYQRMQSPTR